jgi:tRNA (cmo5U34)-methyltransferase
MNDVRDTVVPAAKWEFNPDVTDAFEDMLERSIPQYEVMRQTTLNIGSQFVQANTQIVDLGCSRGSSLAPFVERFGAGNRYVGVEMSDPMFEASTKRFENLIDPSLVLIMNEDLRDGLPLRVQNASLILSVLTLQFIPIEYRQRLLSQCYSRLEDGGAFILVEKVLGEDARLEEVFTSVYYKLKKENRYTEDQIRAKRKSLEGVLVPVTAKWNEEFLHQAGFRAVDCFWRWSNFAGWIAVK